MEDHFSEDVYRRPTGKVVSVSESLYLPSIHERHPVGVACSLVDRLTGLDKRLALPVHPTEIGMLLSELESIAGDLRELSYVMECKLSDGWQSYFD